MKIINEIIYFVFPLLFSGLIHHFIIIRYNLLNFLAKPIDNGYNFRGKPFLGRSKTWRGILVVPVLSSIGSLIISQAISIPTILHPAWVGFLLGLGYATAELPNSFLKRQLGIPASKQVHDKAGVFFLIVDQIDSVLGAIIIMILIYPAGLALCLLVLIIGGLLHLLVDSYLHRYGYKILRND
jgi:hypothetical protein